MTRLKLIRSGGIAGAIMSAETAVEMSAEAIKSIAESCVPAHNPLLRDGISHTLVIDGRHHYSVDIGKIKGRLKKIIQEELLDNLKAEEF